MNDQLPTPLWTCPTCGYDLRTHRRWASICPECGCRALPRRFGRLRVLVAAIITTAVATAGVGSIATLVAGLHAYARPIPIAATIAASLVAFGHALSSRLARNAISRRRDVVVTYGLAVTAYGLTSFALTPALVSWDLPTSVPAGALPGLSGTDLVESVVFLARLCVASLLLSPALLPLAWLLRELAWRFATTRIGRMPWPDPDTA